MKKYYLKRDHKIINVMAGIILFITLYIIYRNGFDLHLLGYARTLFYFFGLIAGSYFCLRPFSNTIEIAPDSIIFRDGLMTKRIFYFSQIDFIEHQFRTKIVIHLKGSKRSVPVPYNFVDKDTFVKELKDKKIKIIERA